MADEKGRKKRINLLEWSLQNNKRLLDEWDYEKNGELKPENISAGSEKNVWWICEKGHTWEQSPVGRHRKEGCPYCSNHRVLVGYNDLATTAPELLKEWNYDRNTVKPTEITKSSNKKIWWKCSEGHEWEVKACSRVSFKSGCPYCSGRRAIPGKTDLATTNPDLAAEWNYERNEITPSEISSGSGKKVWWKCSEGHEYEAIVYDRANGNGCPYCAGKKVLKGYNDLASNYPDIAKEWDYEKNAKRPDEVTEGSSKKVWWKCKKCSFSWEALIYSRTRNKSGCPVCSIEINTVNRQKTILKNRGSLIDTNGSLLKEWDYDKNTIDPAEVTSGSGKSVWWVCSKGHSYKLQIYHKVAGIGCPICAKEQSSSFPEQAVYYYIVRYFSDAINGDRTQISPYELDIYIPQKGVAIEYDGYAFHTDADKDIKKYEKCKEKGIELIRIREKGCQIIGYGKQYEYNYGDTDKLNRIIADILRSLGIEAKDIDIEKDRQEILALFLHKEKEKSFVNEYPDLLKEWNYNKNGKLNPRTLSFGSTKKVWWICGKGHEWQSTVSNRRLNKCPFCSNQKILSGYNDLATTNPEILGEWDYSRNEELGLRPTNVASGTNKKAWWKCSKGHQWMALIYNRVIKKSGCPYCSGFYVIEGETDFATTHPDLLKEWDYSKNQIDPHQVKEGNRQKVWWICPKGHSYSAPISQRLRGSGCSICANKKVLPGYNDFASRCPHLLAEWDYKKNQEIRLEPEQITAGNRKKAWWICPKGHSYQAAVCERARSDGKETGCPICANKKIVVGYNDLQTTNPELIKEWDWKKNNLIGMIPGELCAGSQRKAWWICGEGHEWKAVIGSRALAKCGCPYCGGKVAIPGKNDLATTHPEMLKKWDYDRNLMAPTEVKAGSGKTIFWRCSKGHQWKKKMQAAVKSNHCPICGE